MPTATFTTTQPVTTSTQLRYCFTEGCGAKEWPHLTPIATATAALNVDARALKTITETHIFMEPVRPQFCA